MRVGGARRGARQARGRAELASDGAGGLEAGAASAPGRPDPAPPSPESTLPSCAPPLRKGPGGCGPGARVGLCAVACSGGRRVDRRKALSECGAAGTPTRAGAGLPASSRRPRACTCPPRRALRLCAFLLKTRHPAHHGTRTGQTPAEGHSAVLTSSQNGHGHQKQNCHRPEAAEDT